MSLKLLIKPIQFFRLISLIATYIMGAGLVQFVASIRNEWTLIEGLLLLILVVLTQDYLQALMVFSDSANQRADLSESEIRRMRYVYAIAAGGLSTIAVFIFVHWMLNGYLNQNAFALLALFVAVTALLIIANRREAWRPLLPLIEAVQVIILSPALAFFLQSREYHALLFMFSVGLIPVYLANRLLHGLMSYADDLRTENKTAVMVMGWQNAMLLHNALILLTFVLFGLLSLLGFPWLLLWPVFLSVPFGLMEIWLMERVRRGQKPLWGAMQWATAAVFFLPLYYLSFAFWTR